MINKRVIRVCIIILVNLCIKININANIEDRGAIFSQALADSYSRKCDQAIEKVQKLLSENCNEANYYEVLYNCFGITSIDIERYLKELSNGNKNVALPYYALGRYYLYVKDYDKAIENFIKAYEIKRDDLNIPYFLGKSYLKANKISEGFNYFNKIDSSIWSREIGITFLEVNGKNNIESIKKLEELYKEHSNSWQLADYIREFYFRIDEDSKAREWAFIELENGRNDNNQKEVADSLSAIAAHSINIGDIITGRKYSELAAEKWMEIGDYMQATEWNKNTAMLLLDEGRVNTAINMYMKALNLAKEFEFPIELCLINNSLGFFYERQLGEAEKALYYFKEALPSCELVNRKANTLLGMANAYIRMGKNREGKFYIDEAKKIYGDKISSFDEWGLLSSECLYFSSILDWKGAENKCNKMLKLASKSYLNEMISLYINAELYYKMGDFKKVIELAEKAKIIADLINNFRYQWPIRLILANSYRRLGKLDEALYLYQEAFDLIEKIRRESAAPQFKMFYYQTMDDVYNNYLLALWEKYSKLKRDVDKQDQNELELKEKAFLIAIKAKSRALSEMLIREKELLDIEENPDIKKAVQDISILQAKIMKLVNDKEKTSELDEIKEELEKKYIEYQVLREVAESKYIGIGDFSEKFSLTNLQNNLLDNEVILEFKIMEDEGFCFIVSKEKLEWIRITDMKDIKNKIDILIKSIYKPDRISRGVFQMSSYEIYQKFFKHFVKEISFYKHLVIAPDNILYNLPFEAILLKPPIGIDQLDYLINHYSISYIPSSHIFYALRNCEEFNNEYRMLLIAAPDYSNEYLDHYRSAFDLNQPLGKLKFAHEEARNILDIKAFEIDKFIGEDATEVNLKKALVNKYNFLHFAVHGLVNKQEPDLSGLLLKPGSVEEDGIFQAFEIGKYSIKSRLVFLSACNSVAGKIYSGEGMIGLSTAFMHSGALRIIGTTWLIDDYATNLLVQKFYKELTKNTNYFANALRIAQLYLINTKRYSHPYYWAAFRLIGLN